ncbi:hypothetical protein EDE09_11322 [Neorhizobium sp. S3-V5DH]|nr:hypothetical protein EDE09_11322 [Neorhizobium sp. S3-V5DH]
MVNDLLKELYHKVSIPHSLCCPRPRLAIDNKRLSMVDRQGTRIRLSVALDDRKRLVFRPFEQISARFGGTVSALQATHSGPGIRLRCGFPHHSSAQPTLLAPLLLRSPYFQVFPAQMAIRARFTLATAGCPFGVAFRVWRRCIWTIKHACNWSISQAFLICTNHQKSARKNHGKAASRQSIAGPKTSYRLCACLDPLLGHDAQMASCGRRL